MQVVRRDPGRSPGAGDEPRGLHFVRIKSWNDDSRTQPISEGEMDMKLTLTIGSVSCLLSGLEWACGNHKMSAFFALLSAAWLALYISERKNETNKRRN